MNFYKGLGILESLNEVGDLIKVNSVDASVEKHVPFCEIKDDKVYVTVGEVVHPMEEDHYIEWIAMVKGNKIVKYLLKPNDEPKAIFDYEKDSTIYAYCNKHGLWKKEI